MSLILKESCLASLCQRPFTISHQKMKLSKIKIVFMALFSQFVTVTSLDLTLLPVSVFESFQSVGRSNILTTHPGMLLLHHSSNSTDQYMYFVFQQIKILRKILSRGSCIKIFNPKSTTLQSPRENCSELYNHPWIRDF